MAKTFKITETRTATRTIEVPDDTIEEQIIAWAEDHPIDSVYYENDYREVDSIEVHEVNSILEADIQLQKEDLEYEFEVEE